MIILNDSIVKNIKSEQCQGCKRMEAENKKLKFDYGSYRRMYEDMCFKSTLDSANNLKKYENNYSVLQKEIAWLKDKNQKLQAEIQRLKDKLARYITPEAVMEIKKEHPSDKQKESG